MLPCEAEGTNVQERLSISVMNGTRQYGNSRPLIAAPTYMREAVVITGASAGVGRATAREFARHGASIGLIARDRERLEATRSEVEALGGRAIVLPLDVADASAVEKAASTVEATFGPIDIWVNNAMVTVFSSTMSPAFLR